MIGNKFNITKKMFGNLQYDLSISLHDNYDYCVSDFEESIKKCEKDM